MGPGTASDARLSSGLVLCGAHIASPDEFVITRATLRLDGLAQVCTTPTVVDDQFVRFVARDGTGPPERAVTVPGASLTFTLSPDDDVELTLALLEGLRFE